MMKILLFALFTASIASAQTPALKDDFSAPQLDVRRAARGEWKFTDHVATCTQDDALYEKFKQHGPIIFYNRAYTDGTIRFSFKADKAKTVVFTANSEKSHVFRFVASAAGTSIRAFESGDEHKSMELDKGPPLKQGEWTDVVVDLRGPKAMLKIGKDYSKTVESPYLAVPKINFSIGFSFGTLSIKDVAME